MNYKYSALFLLMLVVVGVFLIIDKPKEEVRTDGKWVTYYWDLDDARVYYKGFVLQNGMSEFNIIAICSEVTKECRKPYKQEVEQDKYIPQSQIK